MVVYIEFINFYKREIVGIKIKTYEIWMKDLVIRCAYIVYVIIFINSVINDAVYQPNPIVSISHANARRPNIHKYLEDNNLVANVVNEYAWNFV